MHKILTSTHRKFIFDASLAAGIAPSDAEAVADGLLWGDLHGRLEYGLIRLPNLIERVCRGLTHSPARMAWAIISPAAHQLDAGQGLGFTAGKLATERAVELARAQGVGVVTVKHSSHYGAAAYYCEQAAQAGCIGFTCTNAFPKVAPFNGTSPVLGTNPLAFGCPTLDGRPVLVDFATSAVAGSAVRKAEGCRTDLPPEAALDARGRPTSDPLVAASGALLPAAGAKGYALALMVEILSGVLTGAGVAKDVGSLFQTWDRPVDVGHFFLAIQIERFMPMDKFLARLDILSAWVKSSPAINAFDPVRIPGEIRADYAARYASEGVPYTEAMECAARTLAKQFSLPPPWEMRAGGSG